MVSVKEAKRLIELWSKKPESIRVNLYEATNLVLAEDIYSSIDSPPFNQSAVDGYAFKFSKGILKSGLTIDGEVTAGDSPNIGTKTGTACRIFTGAQVPEGFDTIVMQECTEISGATIFIRDKNCRKGMNIRLMGSQIKKGALAIKSGTKISPGVAGFLSGIGVSKVKVTRPPRISIIGTGNELIVPGKTLTPGKVFESNTYSLNAALAASGIRPIAIHHTKDTMSEIIKAINNCLKKSDLLILSGGVSVGDYDFVAEALHYCGVKCIFHGVKQKPGKPMYFGVKERAMVFGLPGNPAASLTCFYEYILPTLMRLMGNRVMNGKEKLFMSESYKKKPGFTYFLKGKSIGNTVHILDAQQSYIMSSFAMANCIIQLDENRTIFKKGEPVEIQYLHH